LMFQKDSQKCHGLMISSRLAKIKFGSFSQKMEN